MKRTERDRARRVIILPLTTAEEHIAIQKESKTKPEDEDINLKFLRALPSSWSQMSKDTLLFPQANMQDQAILYLLVPPVLAKRCLMEIVQIILQQLSTLFHQTRRLGLTYKIEKLDLEEVDLKWKMAMLSVRVHKFEQKVGRKINFNKKESARFNKKKDAIEEGDAKIYNLITRADTKEASTAGDAGEFALMGVTFELTLEDKIRVLSIELENTSNLLKHSKRINAIVETAKKDLQEKLDNHLVKLVQKLFRLIDSSMSVSTKVGLGFNNCIRENELGWDDSAFSVFTTNSEDVEGRHLFHRFAKADSMKDVPPPLSRDYTSLSDRSDLDESHMSYGINSSTSSDSKSMSNI
nr:ribonuclease H-like domain-containing protein [Tanacetum cinerariifolium]